MLLRTVEKFLRDHDLPASTFGRLVANDPRLMIDLRLGRTPRPDMERRIKEFMAHYAESVAKS
jgi:hypothetical protein